MPEARIEDLNEIEKCLAILRETIHWLIEHKVEVFSSEIQMPAYYSWQAEKIRLDQGIDQLKGASSEDREALNEHGLTGDSLKFKMAGIRMWQSRFHDVRRTLPTAWPIVKRIARKLLEWLDIILDSLSTVFTILGPVAELKRGLEEDIDVI